jgi:hypothetical protein
LLQFVDGQLTQIWKHLARWAGSLLGRPRKIVWWYCWGCCCVWAAWQLPVDFDEPIYLQAGYDYAERLSAGDWNGVIDYPGTSESPPLVKLLYGLVVLGLGPRASWETAMFASRLVSVAFGTLAVWLVALVDPLAGGLLAVQTLAVKYTGQAYLEALPQAMALLAVFALRRSQKERDGWFWLSAAALGLTAAGKYSYFPILVVILYVALDEKRYRMGGLTLYLGAAGLAFLAFDPALCTTRPTGCSIRCSTMPNIRRALMFNNPAIPGTSRSCGFALAWLYLAPGGVLLLRPGWADLPVRAGGLVVGAPGASLGAGLDDQRDVLPTALADQVAAVHAGAAAGDLPGGGTRAAAAVSIIPRAGGILGLAAHHVPKAVAKIHPRWGSGDRPADPGGGRQQRLPGI